MAFLKDTPSGKITGIARLEGKSLIVPLIVM